jgi:hypothetical protein
LAKEWADKDKYHPSNDVLQPDMQMPRSKAIVSTFLARRDRSMAGGAAGLAPPVRLVRPTCQTGESSHEW